MSRGFSAEERDMIEAFIATRGTTVCPPRFAAPSAHACISRVGVAAVPPPEPEPSRRGTVPERAAKAWRLFVEERIPMSAVADRLGCHEVYAYKLTNAHARTSHTAARLLAARQAEIRAEGRRLRVAAAQRRYRAFLDAERSATAAGVPEDRETKVRRGGGRRQRRRNAASKTPKAPTISAKRAAIERRDKEAWRLYVVEQLPTAEVVARLGVSEESLRLSIRRHAEGDPAMEAARAARAALGRSAPRRPPPEAWQLHVVEGLPLKEVAARLGRPTSTIYSAVRRHAAGCPERAALLAAREAPRRPAAVRAVPNVQRDALRDALAQGFGPRQAAAIVGVSQTQAAELWRSMQGSAG